MIRTFTHSFDPLAVSPVTTPLVELEVTEIEDAGIREVLQTPGATYGTWSILDALLTATGSGTPFVFKQPLGHAREVKVALSGLFGRFVARAYLERYFDLSVFSHVTLSSFLLDKRRRIHIRRRSRGDLPDWVACKANLSSLTVAEAKGCHDVGGPGKALARAWDQVHRVDIKVKSGKVTTKRIAIATRWGNATAGPVDPHISVRDPLDEGEPISPDDEDALYIGLLRQHLANLLEPLGHIKLAAAMRRVALSLSPHDIEGDLPEARRILESTRVHSVEGSNVREGLLGGFVTRAGPLSDEVAGPADQEVLARLNLRPVFVGVERGVVLAAIEGNAESVRSRSEPKIAVGDTARSDRLGGWIIPIGKSRIVRGD